MSALHQDFSSVTRHIRNLRGGSAPILAQASDGLLYVVKFSNNLQGANLSFNESIGSELYQACGLAVPSWKPLLVSDEFLDQNEDCWMQSAEGSLRPHAGLCFGSRFLGEEGHRLLEILPGTYFSRIRNRESFWLAWLVDICAGHIDNRQAIFQEDGTGWLDAYYIDHGHLFGGPEGYQQRHFQASRFLDGRIYPQVSARQLQNIKKVAQSVDADRLWRRIQTLPDEWVTSSALNNFSQCLGRLSSSNLLQNVLDTLVEAQQQINGIAASAMPVRRMAPGKVLCPGGTTAGLGHCLVASPYDCAACA